LRYIFISFFCYYCLDCPEGEYVWWKREVWHKLYAFEWNMFRFIFILFVKYEDIKRSFFVVFISWVNKLDIYIPDADFFPWQIRIIYLFVFSRFFFTLRWAVEEGKFFNWSILDDICLKTSLNNWRFIDVTIKITI
jgi:hypothetical protein